MTAPSIAAHSLRTFYSLSFIISKFGGVTSTTGLTELRKAFYTAIDILVTDARTAEELLVDICTSANGSVLGISHPSTQATRSFLLATIEQLIPVTTDTIIEIHVLPFCLPHLNEPSFRETYEAAHSVILSVFAAHAKRRGESGITSTADKPPIAETLVPFYCDCLLENSADGKLSVEQLRLAFSNLVESASESCEFQNRLARFCIESLLARQRTASSGEERRKQQLTLISLISRVPIQLLPEVLETIGRLLKDESTVGQNKRELLEATFEEILKNVNGSEKGMCMAWWDGVVQENTDAFIAEDPS